MFFSDPVPDGPEVVVPGVFTAMAVSVGVIATVVLGIVPQPVLNLASHAANQLFVR
jgi:NADH-quinone oxidoreductase subunit N